MITSKLMSLAAAGILLAFTACGSPTDQGSDGGDGGNQGGTGAPTVASTSPANNATGVALNAGVSANFSQAMTSSTLTASSFTLTSGTPPVAVAGTVLYASSKAAFKPTVQLNSNTQYTATITTAAKNGSGVALASAHSWVFTTGTTTVAGNPVDLGTATDFAILAKAGITTVPTSVVTGNVGISPADSTAITGFSLTSAADPIVFSTSAQVTGHVLAADYAAPTPADLTASVSDMELAFTDAAGRAPDFTELGAGTLGGVTLGAGVYKWGTGVLVSTNITLAGGPNEVWIFQIAKDLTVASGVNVTLAGGAVAKNVFWQVAGKVELGTTAHLEGTILTQTAITLKTGASVNGRLFAQTAVALDGSTVVKPSP